MLRSCGKREDIVDSASLFVVMYRLGRIGAPPAAEIKPKVGTFSVEDSCAKAIAVDCCQSRCTADLNKNKKKIKKIKK